VGGSSPCALRGHPRFYSDDRFLLCDVAGYFDKLSPVDDVFHVEEDHSGLRVRAQVFEKVILADIGLVSHADEF